MNETNTQPTVRTPDGRTPAVEEAGDPDGRPVLVHMGTPNSRHLYGPNAIDAPTRGLRLICYDRPGYGGSTPDPGRDVAACAADVRAICAELGIGRLAMWGISGGGPHVLACAGLLPDLVVAVASLASLAPLDADGLDWTEGMGQADADDSELVRKNPASPWGFQLASISVPVMVMHGRQDKFVPFGHGEWLTAHVPGAEARLYDYDGHLTLLANRIGEVHAWLAGHF